MDCQQSSSKKSKKKKQKYYQVQSSENEQQDYEVKQYEGFNQKNEQNQQFQQDHVQNKQSEQDEQNYYNSRSSEDQKSELLQQSTPYQTSKKSLNKEQNLRRLQMQNQQLQVQNQQLHFQNLTIKQQNQILLSQNQLLSSQLQQLKSLTSPIISSIIHNNQNLQQNPKPSSQQPELNLNGSPILTHEQFHFQQQLRNSFLPRKVKSFNILYQASKHYFHIDEFYKTHGHKKNTVMVCLTDKNKIIGGYSPFSHKYTGEYRTKEWIYAYDTDKLWLTKDKGEKYECVPDFKKQSFLFQLTRQSAENFHKLGLKNQKQSIQRHQKNKCIYFGSGELIIGQYPYFYYQYKMKQKEDYNTCMSFNLSTNLSSYRFMQNQQQVNQNRYLNIGSYFNLWNPTFTTKYQNQSEIMCNRQNWLEKMGKSYHNQLRWNGSKTNIFLLKEWECWEVEFQQQDQTQKQLLLFYSQPSNYHINCLKNLKQLNKKINTQKSQILRHEILPQSNILSQHPSLLPKLMSMFDFRMIHKINCVYKASQNEFSTKRFFQKCGAIPSLIILVETDRGCVLGGYSSLYFSILSQYDSSVQDSLHESFTFSLLNKSYKQQKFKFINKTNSIRRAQSDKSIRFGGGMLVIEDKNREGWSYVGNTTYLSHRYRNSKQSYLQYLNELNKYFVIKEWQVLQVVFK